MGAAGGSDGSLRRCEVLIVGAGASGLLLAALLAQRGVDVVVLERRPRPSGHSRAIGLHPPALDALRAVGLEQLALEEGMPIRGGVARSGRHELGELTFERAWPERPFVLALPQHRTEALLSARVRELAPGALHRGWDVTEVQEDGTGVHVSARPSSAAGAVPADAIERSTWRAQVLVGADGANSGVRQHAGIGVRERPYADTYLMGDFADTTGDGPTAVIYLAAGGVVESFPLPGSVRRWVAHTGAATVDPSPEGLARLVQDRTGAAPDARTCTMLSAFRVRRRLAERMVTGRQVLVGDAAHEISPIGGQGMTLGWLDALALAPLLAQALDEAMPRPLHTQPCFSEFERSRLRAAARAAWQAEVNMVAGRPLGLPGRYVRDTAIRAVLGTPLRSWLGAAFTMRWAAGRQSVNPPEPVRRRQDRSGRLAGTPPPGPS